MCYSKRQYDNRIQKLQDLEARKTEIEEQIAKIKEDIQNDMGDKELIETDLFKIRWTRVIGSRFDSKRFKKEQAALYQEYQTATETRRFHYATV